jgi:hypothetical protein
MAPALKIHLALQLHSSDWIAWIAWIAQMAD